eukprot:1932149-Amphidinium_carterae.2
MTERHSVASGGMSAEGKVEPSNLCTVLRVSALEGASPKELIAWNAFMGCPRFANFSSVAACCASSSCSCGWRGRAVLVG